MNTSIKIGIIGVGRFGRNYLRTFNKLENANVKWICATKGSTLKEALSEVKTSYAVKSTTNYKDILDDEEVDAVAIVTPGSAHYALAKEALNSGNHVIVEKPLAFSSKDAEELIKISNEKKKILAVSQIHKFNPGIQKLKEDIKSGKFGKINYILYSHFGNGPARKDMGALWDFFPHNVSILLYLLGESPLRVTANGASFLQKGIEDVATMNLIFPKNIFAAATASWLYPIKKMNIVIVGEKLFATFDDYAKKEKLKYYDKIEDKGYTSPNIDDAKPLTEQLKHFLDCIANNKKPSTDGREALKTVKVLEAAQKSLENNGRMVEI